jgi:GTP cyclohydrolase III
MTTTPQVDELLREMSERVDGLLNLHRKMLEAVRRQRPYPVSIRLGESDLDAVLYAATALERATSAIANNTDGETSRG